MHFVMRKKNLFGTKEMRSKQLQTLQQKNAFHLIVSRSDLLTNLTEMQKRLYDTRARTNYHVNDH